MNTRNIGLTLFWAGLGTVGAIAVLPYLIVINPIPADLPISLPLLLTIQMVQTFVLLLVMCYIGLRLGRSVNLDSPLARAWINGKPSLFSRRTAVIAAGMGILAAIGLLGLDMILLPMMPTPIGGELPEVARWKGFLASFYGGITEELQLRLFFMTLLAWIGWRLSGRPTTVSASMMWGAIVIAAILFGVGHLPAAAAIWELTPLVVGRIIILNALGGIVFGFLYWRHGLEYAMIAHFCADIMLHVIVG